MQLLLMCAAATLTAAQLREEAVQLPQELNVDQAVIDDLADRGDHCIDFIPCFVKHLTFIHTCR